MHGICCTAGPVVGSSFDRPSRGSLDHSEPLTGLSTVVFVKEAKEILGGLSETRRSGSGEASG